MLFKHQLAPVQSEPLLCATTCGPGEQDVLILARTLPRRVHAYHWDRLLGTFAFEADIVCLIAASGQEVDQPEVLAGCSTGCVYRLQHSAFIAGHNLYKVTESDRRFTHLSLSHLAAVNDEAVVAYGPQAGTAVYHVREKDKVLASLPQWDERGPLTSMCVTALPLEGLITKDWRVSITKPGQERTVVVGGDAEGCVRWAAIDGSGDGGVLGALLGTAIATTLAIGGGVVVVGRDGKVGSVGPDANGGGEQRLDGGAVEAVCAVRREAIAHLTQGTVWLTSVPPSLQPSLFKRSSTAVPLPADTVALCSWQPITTPTVKPILLALTRRGRLLCIDAPVTTATAIPTDKDLQDPRATLQHLEATCLETAALQTRVGEVGLALDSVRTSFAVVQAHRLGLLKGMITVTQDLRGTPTCVVGSVENVSGEVLGLGGWVLSLRLRQLGRNSAHGSSQPLAELPSPGSASVSLTLPCGCTPPVHAMLVLQRWPDGGSAGDAGVCLTVVERRVDVLDLGRVPVDVPAVPSVLRAMEAEAVVAGRAVEGWEGTLSRLLASEEQPLHPTAAQRGPPKACISDDRPEMPPPRALTSVSLLIRCPSTTSAAALTLPDILGHCPAARFAADERSMAVEDLRGKVMVGRLINGPEGPNFCKLTLSATDVGLLREACVACCRRLALRSRVTVRGGNDREKGGDDYVKELDALSEDVQLFRAGWNGYGPTPAVGDDVDRLEQTVDRLIAAENKLQRLTAASLIFDLADGSSAQDTT